MTNEEEKKIRAGLENASKKLSPISEEEKESRREAVEYAKASVGLEGIYLSDALLAITEEYIEGLLTREEFTQKYIEAVRARK